MSDSSSILGRINELIDGDKLSLPVFNQVALRLRELSARDEVDVGEVERLIVSDQSLVAEVLRASNSPYYGGLATVRTIRNAIIRIGIKQVTRLVCLASEHSKYAAQDPELSAMLQELWRHSSATAMASQWLAKRMRYDGLEDECFLGGLLHDVGQLLILRALDRIKKDSGQGLSLSPQLIKEIQTTAHAQLGHNLLRRWNIPEVYCRVALSHHAPEFDVADLTLVIIRLANEATRKLGIHSDPDPSLVLFATPEARVLKISDVNLAELEVMIEDYIAHPS